MGVVDPPENIKQQNNKITNLNEEVEGAIYEGRRKKKKKKGSRFDSLTRTVLGRR